MKWNVNSLVIEVTRRCNMGCAHCLRGEAQNINIDTRYIERLLDEVDSIGTITFSGGEPSLNVNAIKAIRLACEKRNIWVGKFFIATNGKDNVLPLLYECIEWYAYTEEQDMNMLCLSTDIYHEDINPMHLRLLKSMSFFDDQCKHNESYKYGLINEGRAKNLHTLKREADAYLEIDFDNQTVDGDLYLSANGDIKTCCDIAFDNDRFTIGNIATTSLSEAIISTMETLPV